MKISDMVEPTPEIILEVKKSYNRILKRQQEAGKYLDDTSIPITEREKHILAFRIEIVEPLNTYLEVLRDWQVEVTEHEILNGFSV